MEKITLLKFFEVLSSKIRCCFLSKSTISRSGFFKYINNLQVDTRDELKKTKNNLLHYSMVIILCLSGIISWSQNGVIKKASVPKGTLAFIDAAAHINKVDNPWAVEYPEKNAVKLDYMKYNIQNGIIYAEKSYSVTPSLLTIASSSPCTATRWDSGEAWKKDASGNWSGIPASGQTQPQGVVGCASAAATQSGLQAFAGIYNPSDFAITGLTDCFSQVNESFGNTVGLPTTGEQIVWFNFDIRPLAGTYQFQVVTNENVGWALYYVDPDKALPTAVTPGSTYPPTATGLSGDCTALLPAYIKVGESTHGNCGIAGNGWSTITVPSFKKPTNYYLAMWMANPAVTTFPGSMNLVYKARFGCGGATCTLNYQNKGTTCDIGGYKVCLDYAGSAGRWNLVDNAATKATLYTIKTYKIDGVTLVDELSSSNLGTNPLKLTLGIVPDGAVYATICATYATGLSYDLSLTPDPTYSGGTGYVQCTDGDRQSGGAPICCIPPKITCPIDRIVECPQSTNPDDTGRATSTDGCGTVTITYSDDFVSSCGNTGVITRTWKATDANQDFVTCVQKITIVDITDPVIDALPAVSTIDCPATPVFAQATASDLCDAEVGLAFNDVTTPGSCPGNYSVTRTWTATDDCGNTSEASQTINVQDITPPTLTCPPSFSVDCGTEPVFGTPTASDNCDASLELTFSDSTNADLSQTTRTWTATDDCGNKSTCSQTITVGFCGHLYPTATTCCSYRNGSAQAFTQVCYTTKGSKVSNATPGVFFYYAKIIAPSTIFSVDVLQAKGCNNELRLFLIQKDQIILWDVNCNKASNATITPQSSDGKATIRIDGAVAGDEYVISVKYDTKSIVGATFPKDGNCTYIFKSQIGGVTVPGSVGQITASKNCQVGTINAGTCSNTNTSTSTVAKTTETSALIDVKIDAAGFDAYPVPFKDQLTIKYNFDYVSDVKIEVFNAEGISVLTKEDTNSYLNKEITLELHANKDQEQVYLVKVTTNRGSSVKKVMSSK